MTALAQIANRILVVRDVRVMLDSDLASLYGVTVRRLNEQVRRNPGRFPPDFCFSPTNQDLAVLRSHFATSSTELSRRLDELERKLGTQDRTVAHILDTLRRLTEPTDPPGRRRIGFL